MISIVCAGIDVDIDVEHEGQRTKVTPPSQSGSMEEDMEVAGAKSGGGASGEGEASSEGKASGEGEASGEGGTSEGGTSEGAKVSLSAHLCDVVQVTSAASQGSVKAHEIHACDRQTRRDITA